MSSPPTAYVRQADFTGFSSTHPDEQQNGVDLDDELNALKVTTDQTLTRLSEVQRSDGALQNAIVTPDSLSSNVLAFFTALGTTPRGNWLTATAYVARDLTVQSGTVYICLIAHTAGVFATDLAAGKWQILSNAAGNQTLNTTSNVQFSNITATGNVAISGTMGAGNSTINGWLLVNCVARVGTEEARVNGDLYVDNGILMTQSFKKVVNAKINQTAGVNCDLFHITNDPAVNNAHVALKIRIWAYNADVQPDYAWIYVEFMVKIRSSGGVDQGSVTNMFVEQGSINSGVINFASLGFTLTRSGDTNVVYVNPTITGSGASTKFTVYAEAEALGLLANTLVAA